MARADDSSPFPLWARLTLAFLVAAVWLESYVSQSWGQPGPSPVLNAAFILVVGSVFSHELGRAVARVLRRVLAEADRDD